VEFACAGQSDLLDQSEVTLLAVHSTGDETPRLRQLSRFMEYAWRI
jgi:hypothetical protein